MTPLGKELVYHAHWQESGTNDWQSASAASKADLDKLIFGSAYGPKTSSIMYWTTEK